MKANTPNTTRVDAGTQTNSNADIHAIKLLEAINDWMASGLPEPTDVVMFSGSRASSSSSSSSQKEPEKPGLFFQFLNLFRSEPITPPSPPSPPTFKEVETQTENVYQSELARGKLIRGELNKYF